MKFIRFIRCRYIKIISCVKISLLKTIKTIFLSLPTSICPYKNTRICTSTYKQIRTHITSFHVSSLEKAYTLQKHRIIRVENADDTSNSTRKWGKSNGKNWKERKNFNQIEEAISGAAKCQPKDTRMTRQCSLDARIRTTVQDRQNVCKISTRFRWISF